jgi:large subunit ribosomal protein L1
MANEGGAE